MRNILFILLLYLSITAFGQKIIDTTELYNGVMTAKRIEFNSTGEILKETFYYHNGNIEAEDFFDHGKNIHWIAFDTAGNQISEWLDPEPGNITKRKTRNIIFSITLLSASLLVLWGTRVNFKNTYYSILILSLFYPFIIFLVEQRLFTSNSNPILDSVIASLLFILPGLLLLLSVVNFFKKDKISLVTSIFAILVSIGFLLSYIMIMNFAGVGIVG